MPDLSKIYLYRMTHIDNIPHILQFGFTHASSENANKAYAPIGDGSLIATRRNRQLENGKMLGDYIPFYFATRTPMLYVLQNGYNMVKPTAPENVVYCVTSVQKIIDLNLEFLFTDGHAVDSFTTYFEPSEINNINKHIDFQAINATIWKSETDLDLKRRKEAEFLVLGDIAPEAIIGFCTYNANAKNKLLSFGVQDKIVANRNNYYF